jgi:predicted AAA+ superfamily ATPase
LPELLDEVQNLMLENKKLQFVLTGSSARKLKKIKANLLAGRARTREFFTLTSAEMDFKFNLQETLKYGCLPEVLNLETKEEKIDYLESYVQTYLNEEIKQEAIVRALEPFIRFLEVSAIMNGQIWNNSEISREVGSARTTVDGYLSVIIDTLIGYRIESFRPRAKVKEKHNPKYYYFDPGVVRALRGDLHRDIETSQIGYLFETFILNEIKAYSSYRQKKLKVFYWGTPSKNEVDFVIDDGRKKIGLELKTSQNWRAEFNTGLNTLLDGKKIHAAYGIYDGERSLVSGNITVFPVKQFLKKIWNDEIFS